MVEDFVDHIPTQKKQIISLGAGSDTRFYRLMNRELRTGSSCRDRPSVVYHEIDFLENTIGKIRPFMSQSELCRHVLPPSYAYSAKKQSSEAEDTLHAENYHVHPVDLRTLDPFTTPPDSFAYIDRDLPTLLISECCLVYLSPAASDTAALYFTKHFFPASTPLGLIIYEPIKPDDAFGKVMVSNLATRGIVLQTIRKYGSLEAQEARMKAYGFEACGAADVNTLWEVGVEEKEKERVAGLEMVDEVEEWELLAGHYCVCWGWRGKESWDGCKNFPERISPCRSCI